MLDRIESKKSIKETKMRGYFSTRKTRREGERGSEETRKELITWSIDSLVPKEVTILVYRRGTNGI